MDPCARFMQYAEAFEEAYASDDWSKLEPYFTEDAVYETLAEPPFGNRIDGLAAIKANFKQMLDQFDRRFASRTVEFVDGPLERDGNVWCRWTATYTLAGAPDLCLEGEETAVFEGDRIQRLEDRMPRQTTDAAVTFMAEHGAKLTGGAGS